MRFSHVRTSGVAVYVLPGAWPEVWERGQKKRELARARGKWKKGVRETEGKGRTRGREAREGQYKHGELEDERAEYWA